MSLSPAQETHSIPKASLTSIPCLYELQEKSINQIREINPQISDFTGSEWRIQLDNSQRRNASETPSAPRKRLPSYPYEDMSARLHIIVGDGKEFHVQKELLCKHSEYFRDICSDPLAGYQQPIRINHVDADTAASFFGFLHDEDVYLATGISLTVHQKADGPSHAKRQSYFLHLSKCYVLGWDLKAYTFCNAIMDVLVEFSRKGNNLKFIAGGTEEITKYVASEATYTPLHELLDDNYTGFAKTSERLEEFTKIAGTEEMKVLKVLKDISKSETLDKMKELSFPWERDICYYHKHPDDEDGRS